MRLTKKYSTVVRTIMNIFKEQKVDIEETLTAIRFNDVEKTSIFSTDGVFSKITTRMQLFQHVGNYCRGIYDYKALDILVHSSGCQEAIDVLTRFTELLHSSILMEVDLMSEYGELMNPDDLMLGSYKFVIKYVGGKCTLETKEFIENIMEQAVHLKKGMFVFKGFYPGSILFIYQISDVVKKYLLKYTFSVQNLKFLVGNNITRLTVDDTPIMDSLQLNEVITFGNFVL